MIVKRAESFAQTSIADLVADLGDIPLRRIRIHPPLGTATVLDIEKNKGCELIDGTLVEKAMGLRESIIALFLGRVLGQFVSDHRLGLVAGADGTWRFSSDLVRVPDVAFISWSRLPDGVLPDEPVPYLTPDLAVEVLSEGNTKAEMRRKRAEYFAAGVSQVWIVDRFSRTVTVYASEDESHTLMDDDSLDGGTILPGFTLSVRALFDAPNR